MIWDTINFKKISPLLRHAKNYLLPFFAFIGVFVTIKYISTHNKERPIVEPLQSPMVAPFSDYIAAAGMVEPNTEVINLSPHIAGIVSAIHVKEEDLAEEGQLLLTLDNRQVLADKKIAEADILKAQADLIQDHAALKDAQQKLERLKSIEDQRAIALQDLESATLNVQQAEAKVLSSEKLLEARQAHLESIETTLALHEVRAPMDGHILEINVREGEHANVASSAQSPAIKFGHIDPLHVRVDIDERDVWRFKRSTQAVGNLQGNPEMKTTLSFVRMRPYVIPKKNLTNDTTERVDTRVMQAIYSLGPEKIPVQPGQLMDVYIKSLPIRQKAPDAKEQG